jgi:lipopolysaccharide export LptBFGC system permease protein LptF
VPASRSSQSKEAEQPKGLIQNYKNFFNCEIGAPKVSHMQREFQQQQEALVSKRFAEVAHAVIDNRFQAQSFSTHSSITTTQATISKQRTIKAKELPDAGFAYVKNKHVEKVTKQDPELSLPKGTRYNIVIGSL